MIHVNTFVAFAIALSSISPHSLNLRLISSLIFARRGLADQEAPRFFLPRCSNLTVPGICLLTHRVFNKMTSGIFLPLRRQERKVKKIFCILRTWRLCDPSAMLRTCFAGVIVLSLSADIVSSIKSIGDFNG